MPWVVWLLAALTIVPCLAIAVMWAVAGRGRTVVNYDGTPHGFPPYYQRIADEMHDRQGER